MANILVLICLFASCNAYYITRTVTTQYCANQKNFYNGGQSTNYPLDNPIAFAPFSGQTSVPIQTLAITLHWRRINANSAVCPSNTQCPACPGCSYTDTNCGNDEIGYWLVHDNNMSQLWVEIIHNKSDGTGCGAGASPDPTFVGDDSCAPYYDSSNLPQNAAMTFQDGQPYVRTVSGTDAAPTLSSPSGITTTWDPSVVNSTATTVSTFAAFNGRDMLGTWHLYVEDTCSNGATCHTGMDFLFDIVALDLAVDVSASTPTVQLGDSLSWVITVNNYDLSASSADNIEIAITLPSSTDFSIGSFSVVGINGGVCQNTITGTAPNLVWTPVPSGATKLATTQGCQLTISGSIVSIIPVPTSIQTTAALAVVITPPKPNPFDANSANNQDTQSVTITFTDLKVTVTPSASAVPPGQSLYFDIRVEALSSTPVSPSAAGQFSINVPIPANMVFSSAVPVSGGATSCSYSYNPGTGTWTVMTGPSLLPVGQFCTLRVSGTANSNPVGYQVTMNAQTTIPTPKDANYTNNQDSSTILLGGDVSIDLSSSQTTYETLTPVSYTVTVAHVSNGEPDYLEVTLDFPPANVFQVSGVVGGPSTGTVSCSSSYNPSTRIWTVLQSGKLYAGSSCSIVVNGQFLSPPTTAFGTFVGTITNFGPSYYDLNSLNNQDTLQLFTFDRWITLNTLHWSMYLGIPITWDYINVADEPVIIELSQGGTVNKTIVDGSLSGSPTVYTKTFVWKPFNIYPGIYTLSIRTSSGNYFRYPKTIHLFSRSLVY